MGCKIEFDRTSLHKRLGATFMKNEYKTIREGTLFEIEKGLFPATQLIIEREQEIKKLEKSRSMVEKQFEPILAERRAQLTQFIDSEDLRSIKDTIEIYQAMMAGLNIDEEIMDRTSAITQEIKKLHLGKNPPSKTFIRPCPNINCKGTLSKESISDLKNYRCTLCNTIICVDCRDICLDEINHKCNPDTIETIKFIDESSKPCPTCTSPIHKIAGCFDRSIIIPLWDGMNKMAGEIVVGDVLIGDDFQPRTVLELFTGTDMLYRINQSNGAAYIVNSKHNLALIKDNGTKWVIDVSTYLDLLEEEQVELFGYRVNQNSARVIKSGLSVEEYHYGQYYGFVLDGNNKFLYTDNTVLSNCDQMWCTSCNTAFSWKTLKVARGTIHNPHYFEYMRQTGQQDRDPQDIPCGEELNHHDVLVMQRLIRYQMEYYQDTLPSRRIKSMDESARLVNRILERILHHSRDTIQRMQATTMFERNRDLRLQLLRGKTSEATFKTMIQRSDKADSKRQDILNVVVTFRDCATTIARRFKFELDKPDKITPEILESYFTEFKTLREYVNSCLTQTSEVYNSNMYTDILCL